MQRVWQLTDRSHEELFTDGLKSMGMAPVVLKPGKKAGGHSHNLVEEINIFRSGTGQIELEDDCIPVCGGTVVSIPAGMFHEVTNTGSEPLEYIAVFTADVDPKQVKLKLRGEHFAEKAGKPSYARLLNIIAAGECCGAEAFTCWAEKTTHPDLKPILKSIAIREAEHSKAFEKRLCEMGIEVDFSDVGKEVADLLDCLKSDASDLDKLNMFLSFPDQFDMVFQDKTIDAQTGALLGRFIAEERDTIATLRACCEQLTAEASGKVAPAPAASHNGVTIDDVCMAVTELTNTVKDMQKELAMLSASKSGKARQPKNKTKH